MPQTTAQILRCFSLGDYTARVVDGELKIRGPQPLAGPLPASVKANRERIIDFLVGCCGGVWPAAEGSEFVRLKREASAKMVPEVSDKQKRFQEALRSAAMTRRARRFERRDILPAASGRVVGVGNRERKVVSVGRARFTPRQDILPTASSETAKLVRGEK